jgi:hypothetical protein
VSADASGAVAGAIAGEVTAGASLERNYGLGALSAPGAGAVAHGIVGSFAGAPALYRENYYVDATAESDASDVLTPGSGVVPALCTALETLHFANGAGGSPGLYTYLDPAVAPEMDGQGAYLLGTAEELVWFTFKVNANAAPDNADRGLDARLTNNIDLSARPFSGIGGYGGTFEGDGHTITLGTAASPSAPLFVSCNGATLKNLTIAGVVRGAALVSSITGGRVEGCHNEATVLAAPSIPGMAVIYPTAAIAAAAAATSFAGCTNSGSVTAAAGAVGGIVGKLTGPASIEGCKNSGAVTGGEYVGGIVAQATMGADITVSGCENSGVIKAMISQGQSSVGRSSAGGILGFMNGGGGSLTIEGCTNSGSVSGNVASLGGIMGGPADQYTSTVRLTITGCTNSGNVESLYDGAGLGVNVGGILGRTDGLIYGGQSFEIITNNTNTGNISSVEGRGNLSSIVGGMESIRDGMDISNNKSSVLVGNDASNASITYIGPPNNPDPGPDPGPGPEPGPEPGLGPSEPSGTPTVPTVPSVPSAPSAPASGDAAPVGLPGEGEGTGEGTRPGAAPQDAPQPAEQQATPQQPLPEPETPQADSRTATEVALIPLGFGFETVANTLLTIAVGFIALGVFVLGGFIFWRMYRRRIDHK